MDSRIKILLVEDEFITALHVKKQLEKIGYEVTDNVTTGENAIVSAKQNPPDIILMDVRLAGSIDGIEAASAIRADSGIPVIFITGFEDANIRQKSENIKPLEYLIKPLNINRLKVIIDGYFQQN